MLRACLALLLFCACAPQAVVQGRAYEVRAPRGATEPLPVLVLAHGYGATGFAQDVVFPFSKQVEARRFLYVLPNGSTDIRGKHFWNATEDCCNRYGAEVDDVGFFRALLEDVKANHAVQPGKVFIAGHSNGAFMALRLACDAPELFDGVVSVSGSTWRDAQRCGDGRAVPVLFVHGTEDDAVPYAGREDGIPGVVETAERFGRRAGCGGGWEALERADFLGAQSELETDRQRLAGCPAGAPVELWTLENVGHLPVFDGRWTNATLDWLLEHAR